jgi:hypothetical protein
MNATLLHEMSHANYLHLDAYIDVGCDPRRKYHNLLINMHSLSKYLKVIMNSLINESKLF